MMTVGSGASNVLPPVMPPGSFGPNVPAPLYESYPAVQRSIPTYSDRFGEQEFNNFLAEICGNDPSIWPMFHQNPGELASLSNRHYFQSITYMTVSTPTSSFTGIALSDDGACLNFGRAAFFKDHSFRPLGVWKGKIKTLTQVSDIQTPFFKVYLRTRDGKSCPCFVLSTDDIGHKKRVDDRLLLTIAKLLRVPPGLIQNPEGPIDILIGLESSDLLLRQVYSVDGAPVHKSFFSKDLQLAASPVASLLAIKGAVGGSRFGDENSVFYSSSQPANMLRSLDILDQNFVFNSEPSQE